MGRFSNMTKLKILILIILSCSFITSASEVYINKVVDAIYLAEGGEKAKKPYGILSVPCNSKEEGRVICYNTVKRRYQIWQSEGAKGDFITFLGKKYAPVKASQLNNNWVKNVSYYVRKPK